MFVHFIFSWLFTMRSVSSSPGLSIEELSVPEDMVSTTTPLLVGVASSTPIKPQTTPNKVTTKTPISTSPRSITSRSSAHASHQRAVSANTSFLSMRSFMRLVLLFLFYLFFYFFIKEQNILQTMNYLR